MRYIYEHWTTIKKDTGKLISDITNYFKKLPGQILGFLKSLPDDFLALGKKVVTFFVKAFLNIGNTIKHAIGSGISHIASGIGGLLGSVLHLASGGLVTKPTLALVGEAGPEVVAPINQITKLSPQGGVSPLSSVATPMLNPAAPNGSAGTNMTINLRLNGAVYGDMNKAMNDLGRHLATVILPQAGVRLTR